MLGDVRPDVEGGIKAGINEGPEDYGYEEGEGCDGGVEEVVKRLEGTWKAV